LPGRLAEIVAIVALATIVTAAIASPVLRAPSERVFGMEIVGRHHDPFTVMAQFLRPIGIGVSSQPITDISGSLLARISGAVAAYNWLVLLSFPLAAAAAFLLARYLAISPGGAAVAAMAYAFAPFHLAHAAYHPHIAQTQWVPLYLLALWRCLDDASPVAIGFVVAAAVAVTFSNFYAGLIVAAITPVAVAAYWFVLCRKERRSTRHLAITAAALALAAAAGIAYVFDVERALIASRAAFAFPRDDLFRYSARWWSYLVPPVEHPWLGAAARQLWTVAGVHEGLLEQQVSLGWAVVALGLVASFAWLTHGRKIQPYQPDLPNLPNLPNLPASLTRVPVLVVLALAALVCSLSPEWTIGAFTIVRPSALFYVVVPMFRSYARFGVVVQLMAALLAGIGVDWLRRSGTRRARIACGALLAAAACEYAVLPSALSRDVLPTPAHRWVMQQREPMRVLDCTPLDLESASVVWLTNQRVTLLGAAIHDCSETSLSWQLATNGFTHVLVRRGVTDPRAFADLPAPDGTHVVARFDTADVFAVAGQTPAIFTAEMSGFFPREHDAAWAWRWMGADAAWTIVNTVTRPIVARLDLEVAAFQHPRRLVLLLDGQPVQTIVVEPSRRVYQLGPLAVNHGAHRLLFRAAEVPAVAGDVIDNGDRRPLSFALGAWTWDVRGEQP
jgi:hypothetical protein